jgi:AraC-like DNA-binding protein
LLEEARKAKKSWTLELRVSRKRSPKEDTRLHGLVPRNPTLVGSIVGGLFEDLDVGATICTEHTRTRHNEWYVLHGGPKFSELEVQHGLDRQRALYNTQSFAQAHQLNRPVLTSRTGCYDFFVPLGVQEGARTSLAVGPFLKVRPTKSDLLKRWHEIGGRDARLGNPGFARYWATSQAMLALDAPLVSDLECVLAYLCALVTSAGEVQKLAEAAPERIARLRTARAVERMWEAAASAVDPLREWPLAMDREELKRRGVSRIPEHVLVGFVTDVEEEQDPLQSAVHRDGFQRDCVGFATNRGRTLCGRLASHGVLLLVEQTGKSPPRLASLVEKVAARARAYGLRIYFGASPADQPLTTAQRFQAARAAAEQALLRRSALLVAAPRPHQRATSLVELRRQLSDSVRHGAELLSSRFDRYAEAASVRAGYRLERVRIYLEVGLDDIAQSFEKAGVLDARASFELRAGAEQQADHAATVRELVDVYRQAVAAIKPALARPSQARGERSFRRAISYIREHLAEPLSRADVARVAGLAEHYFSRRFLESEGTTFQDFVKGLRVERGKQLLRSTALSVEQVAELSGFGTRVQFHRSFKHATGMTPAAYRSGRRV